MEDTQVALGLFSVRLQGNLTPANAAGFKNSVAIAQKNRCTNIVKEQNQRQVKQPDGLPLRFWSFNSGNIGSYGSYGNSGNRQIRLNRLF